MPMSEAATMPRRRAAWAMFLACFICLVGWAQKFRV